MKVNRLCALAALATAAQCIAQPSGELAPMRDSTTTVPASEAPPVPQFSDSSSRLSYLRWLTAMTERMGRNPPQGQAPIEFLQTAWYESKRAGLDVSLVLGIVEVMSGFHRYSVQPSGALGYMAVDPTWSRRIGDGDVSKLMRPQSNLRFGCVILRQYLDANRGNVSITLHQYVASNLGLADTNPRVEATVNKVFDAQSRWAFVDTPAARQ
ncbi:lytic transglycosylase domain-containing protein [Variovorax fucosicus]|uniref:lytic transglycosylase domain-containing protein n=1 Tax=Variovorax fucosicus TaxID=3053517 RepID=UPI002578E7DF|nr:lytic transglycosylase domain-containing protein [Variovorax sp. J22G47]MDM0057897.1 lytic transglycosylase domain-containing protein [Variovorax sp. J22G47]